MNVREELIQFIQRVLKQRYNKTIVEIRDPFLDMQVLLRQTSVRGIVDGGGYHGEIALRFEQMFPDATIYSFEPFSTSFQILQRQTLNSPRIQPVHRGLSSAKCSVPLYINAQDSTNALSPVCVGGKKYQSWQTKNIGRELVELIPLDDWLQESGAGPIELIKLDLQGHELKALEGASRTLSETVKLVYTEVEFVRIYEDNCLMYEVEAFLRQHQFELFQLYNLTSGDDHQLVCGDAIFVNWGKL